MIQEVAPASSKPLIQEVVAPKPKLSHTVTRTDGGPDGGATQLLAAARDTKEMGWRWVGQGCIISLVPHQVGASSCSSR